MTDTQKHKFRHNENFFRALVEGINSEIFVCDTEGYVVYLNPASEYLTGCKMENILGKHITELERDGTITQNNTMEVIKTGKIITSIQGVKNSRHLLAISMPIYNESNELAYVLTSAQDIGQLSHINQRLIDTNNELRKEMEAMAIYKNEFFADEGLIFVGDAMESMVHTVSRIASLDVIAVSYTHLS